MKSENRKASLTMLDPPPKKIQRIEGVREIAAAILSFLRSNDSPSFFPDRAASDLSGYPIKPNLGSAGWLRQTVFLSDIRREIGREKFERDDSLILEAIDSLSDAGQVRVLEMNYPRFERANDLFFVVVLGAAVKETYYPYTFPTLRAVTWLSSSNVYPGSYIEKPGVVFMSLKAARERELQERFGSRDFELEKRLIHEEILDDAKLRRQIEKIASNLESKK
jgi:hypothetical protein